MLKRTNIVRLALVLLLLAILAVPILGAASISQAAVDGQLSPASFANAEAAAVIACSDPGTSGSGCGGG